MKGRAVVVWTNDPGAVQQATEACAGADKAHTDLWVWEAGDGRQKLLSFVDAFSGVYLAELGRSDGRAQELEVARADDPVPAIVIEQEVAGEESSKSGRAGASWKDKLALRQFELEAQRGGLFVDPTQSGSHSMNVAAKDAVVEIEEGEGIRIRVLAVTEHAVDGQHQRMNAAGEKQWP